MDAENVLSFLRPGDCEKDCTSPKATDCAAAAAARVDEEDRDECDCPICHSQDVIPA